jgi:hypothetical protein
MRALRKTRVERYKGRCRVELESKRQSKKTKYAKKDSKTTFTMA